MEPTSLHAMIYTNFGLLIHLLGEEKTRKHQYPGGTIDLKAVTAKSYLYGFFVQKNIAALKICCDMITEEIKADLKRTLGALRYSVGNKEVFAHEVFDIVSACIVRTDDSHKTLVDVVIHDFDLLLLQQEKARWKGQFSTIQLLKKYSVVTNALFKTHGLPYLYYIMKKYPFAPSSDTQEECVVTYVYPGILFASLLVQHMVCHRHIANCYKVIVCPSVVDVLKGEVCVKALAYLPEEFVKTYDFPQRLRRILCEQIDHHLFTTFWMYVWSVFQLIRWYYVNAKDCIPDEVYLLCRDACRDVLEKSILVLYNEYVSHLASYAHEMDVMVYHPFQNMDVYMEQLPYVVDLFLCQETMHGAMVAHTEFCYRALNLLSPFVEVVVKTHCFVHFVRFYNKSHFDNYMKHKVLTNQCDKYQKGKKLYSHTKIAIRENSILSLLHGTRRVRWDDIRDMIQSSLVES